MNSCCSYEACGEEHSNSSFHRSTSRTEEFNRLSLSRKCIYCDSELSMHRLDKYLPPVSKNNATAESVREGHYQHDFSSLELKNCDCCGWWLLDYGLSYTIYYPSKGVPVHRSKFLYGEVKHYDIGCLEIPLAALRVHLANKPNQLAYLNPTKFELLMQDCFSEYFGAAEVIHTGQTGDGGIDLKMVFTDGETYLIQVKRRAALTSQNSKG